MAFLRGIQYILPQGRRTNDDLVRANAGWDAESIHRKTGIRSRPVVEQGETAGDLGFRAAVSLLDELEMDRRKIDTLIFCTEAADYLLPATACVLHERLGLAASCGAFDINLGCSGYPYGLWLAKALVDSGSAQNVLLVVADTLAQYCGRHDLTTATIFADGAAASLIAREAHPALASIGPSVVGTDGSGAEFLIVRNGGARHPSRLAIAGGDETTQGASADDCLYMNGPGVYSFTLTRVPAAVEELLKRVNLELSEIDLFLFHQANRFLLENLALKMNIPRAKMPIDLEEVGNAGSAALPILVRRCLDRGILQPGQRCVLAGFGVGLSWAVTYVQWGPAPQA
jgi:3-oxoacyl-[acyl-carrier-protein] synthase III